MNSTITSPNPQILSFHQQVEPEGGLDRRNIVRKCHGRDCRLHGRHSFRRTGADGTTTHLHAYCDRLDCPTCRARMTDALSAKLLAAVQRHQLTTCYTLTLRDHPTPEAGFNHALQAFRRLKAAYRRKYGRPLSYILVKSLGQRQRHPHLHVLTTTDVPRRWLRDRWHRLTGATQIHRKLNQAADLPKLVTYMTRNYLLGFDHGLRGRKIQASAGIDVALKPRSDRSGPSEWKRAAVSTRSVALDLNGLQASDPAALYHVPHNPLRVQIPATIPQGCEHSEQPLRSLTFGRSAANAGAAGDGMDDAAGGVRSSTRGGYSTGGGLTLYPLPQPHRAYTMTAPPTFKLNDTEADLLARVWVRLKANGQLRYARGFPPHPNFRDAGLAADNLLRRLNPGTVILAMRDQALSDLRIRALSAGLAVLVPDKTAPCVFRLPSPLWSQNRTSEVPANYRIHPLPYGSELWTGRVDLVVIVCTAWSPNRRRVWTVDAGTTEAVIDALNEAGDPVDPANVSGQPSHRWHLRRDVPVACLAADEQESDPATWPPTYAGQRADIVATPTRLIELGTGRLISGGTAV